MAADAPGGRIEVVGRATELSRLDAFMNDVFDGPAVLLLEGESGIGKSTLWKRGVADGREREWRVLSTRPAESEAKLSFAGLADLLEASDDVLRGLPDPQRNALEVALLRAGPKEASSDARAVSAAVLSALRGAATLGPVLIALDDVQWLDHSTASALGFAVRRVESEPIGLLLATREAGSALPFGLSRALPDDRIARIRLEPLSIDDLGALLQARLGASFPRPTLKRLHEMSGGNPFYALEIAAAELRGEQGVTGQALPIPKSLRQDLVRDRLRTLPALAREALLYASACSRPTLGLLETAMRRADVGLQLAKAADAGIVEADGDEMRFTHPLYGSAIYAEASREHRHRVHRRLGEVVPDPEERARHLALGAEGPDPEIALALEEAAAIANRRGAPAAAAELCEFAERLTPPEGAADVRRLRMTVADYWLLAGDQERALQLIEPVTMTAPEGAERAEALRCLGRVLSSLDEDRRAADVFAEALREEAVPTATQGSILMWRSLALRSAGDLAAAEKDAEAALRLAELGEDPSATADALTALVLVRRFLGRDVPRDLIDRALELERSIEPLFVTDRPSFVLADELILAGELDRARDIHISLLDEATVRGDEDSASVIHIALGRVELLAGKWEVSRDHYERGISLAPKPGNWVGGKALVDVCVGDVGGARADGKEALEASRASGSLLSELLALSALGFLELSLGNASAAEGHLSRAWQIHQGYGFGEPSMWTFVADHLEALIELGRYTEAGEVVESLEERGRALDRPWALAVAGRYRGLLAAGEGDFQAAFAALDRALREHERLPMPFERGRTLLVLGTIRRRAKQKRAARETLEEALAIFERLGAPLWAEKTRAELARIGGRRAVAGELTEAEARVAKLAAAGRTNREIADALFMSVRTVEGHLSRAYHKLGIRSRTELALFFEAAEDATEKP